MKTLRNLAAITLLCLVSVQSADAVGWLWGKKETLTASQKQAQLDLQQAQKHEKQAKKAFELIKHKAKSKGNGYHADYALIKNSDTLYADLAKDPSKVKLYADFASSVYNAVALTDGDHLDVVKVTDIIGEDLLQESGFYVQDVFKRWDHDSEQFSGALLFNQQENTLLVVFAGTASKADGYYDFAFTRHVPETTLNVVPDENYNVHQGFAKAVIDGFGNFKASFDSIVDEALLRGDVKVITTGHSLGGAMSLIAADWIKREVAHEDLTSACIGRPNAVKVQNISFGAPRAFAKATAEQVETRLGKGNILRFWNSIDLVPAIVSGKITGSKHIGLNFKIDDSFWRRTIPGLGYHSMTWYADNAQSTFEKAIKAAEHRAAVESQYKLASEAVLRAKIKN